MEVAIYELNKDLEFDEVVKILYDLSEGAETRPGVKAIQDKFAEKFLEKYTKKEWEKNVKLTSWWEFWAKIWC